MPTRSRPPRRVLMRLLALVAVMVVGSGPAAIAQDPPLVSPGGARDGNVVLAPATQQVTDPVVTWTLANGGDAALTFDLAVHDVDPADATTEVGAPSEDLAVTGPMVTLDPGEVARIPLRLRDVAPRALALVASTRDASPETTLSAIALVGGSGEVRPTVVAADAAAGTATLRLEADGPALVDVAVQASAWPGRPSARTAVTGVLVPTGGRDLVVDVDGPMLGRLRVEAVVASVGEARADAAFWWWPPAATVALLGVLTVALASVLVVRRRGAGLRQS